MAHERHPDIRILGHNVDLSNVPTESPAPSGNEIVISTAQNRFKAADAVSVAGTSRGVVVMTIWSGNQTVRETYNRVNATLAPEPSGARFND